MHFVFVIKTRHKSVSRDNDKITQNEITELFSYEYLTNRCHVAREERIQEKK